MLARTTKTNLALLSHFDNLYVQMSPAPPLRPVMPPEPPQQRQHDGAAEPEMGRVMALPEGLPESERHKRQNGAYPNHRLVWADFELADGGRRAQASIEAFLQPISYR